MCVCRMSTKEIVLKIRKQFNTLILPVCNFEENHLNFMIEASRGSIVSQRVKI